jgi:hyperpolarization activated cyclic nucleotide-gated potassium channel 2
MCYAITIGHVSALVQSFDTSRRLYNEKVKEILRKFQKYFKMLFSINKLKNIWHGENYLEKCVIEYRIIMNIDFKEKSFMKIPF